MSEIINHAVFLPGEPRGERIDSNQCTYNCCTSVSGQHTITGFSWHRRGHWTPWPRFPQAIIATTPRYRWQFDATGVNTDKKGIRQDLRKKIKGNIPHRPLDTSHPSFTNWAQSFCRNTKLSEGLKWHDYFLLGVCFPSLSLEIVFKMTALTEEKNKGG